MIAGVVLCGGRATRLGGGDKPLLPLGAATILDEVIARLSSQVDTLAISANGDPARLERFGLPVLADTIGDRPGPLAGVLAGLRWASALPGRVALVSTAGDTPFLPPDLIERLSQALSADAGMIAVAASGGRTHPVVALWPLTIADALAKTLHAGDNRVLAFIQRHPHVVVDFAIENGVDPFFNINTPQDLALAQSIAGRSG